MSYHVRVYSEAAEDDETLSVDTFSEALALLKTKPSAAPEGHLSVHTGAKLITPQGGLYALNGEKLVHLHGNKDAEAEQHT